LLQSQKRRVIGGGGGKSGRPSKKKKRIVECSEKEQPSGSPSGNLFGSKTDFRSACHTLWVLERKRIGALKANLKKKRKVRATRHKHPDAYGGKSECPSWGNVREVRRDR